jgi:uncharacterized membrane protein
MFKRNWTPIIFACASMVSARYVCADPPATQPSLAQEKAKALAEVPAWQDATVLPPCPVASVFQFKTEDGLLKVDWPLVDSGSTGGLLTLSDLPGKAHLNVYASDNHANGEMFEAYDFSDPKLVFRHYQILANEMRLQVVEDEQFQTSLRTISLIEKLQGSDPDALTLRVQNMGEPPMNGAVFASSLSELGEKYPDEYEEYLRPMFRALRQEQRIFAVNGRAAWQVVADEWSPPADVKARVEAILAKLNSEDFSQRDSAQKQLEEIGEPGALYLMKRDPNGLSAEQKARINTFLLEYSPLDSEHAEALRHNVNYLLDCLLDDDPALRAAAIKLLRRTLGRDIAIDPQAGPDDRGRQIAAIRKALSPASPPPGP